MTAAPLAVTLDEARGLLRDGRLDEAEAAFGRVLAQVPDHLEALNASAMAALHKGQPARCLELLQRAATLAPQDPLTCHNLGLARDAAGDLAGAEASYRAALAADSALDVTRLQLGYVLERLERHREATLAYFGALVSAQSKGRWLNPPTTAPGLRNRVEHAIQFVRRGQREAFEAALEPVRSRYGAPAVQRVLHCLGVYVGDARPAYPDPRQQPTILHFPGLRPRPYLERETFPWLAAFEARTDAIRDELRRILPHAEGRERVFHDARIESANLRGTAPEWNGYYFWRHGERNELNCRKCPQTAAALEALPLARVRGNAPEVLFSVLTPGTHLLPHRGVTNTRLVCHLPLIVPAQCALTVGGEQHAWQEGRAVVFDDTYEHEAWNRSGETRVVLIADVWHPELTEAEREGVAALAAAIAEFRKAGEAQKGAAEKHRA